MLVGGGRGKRARAIEQDKVVCNDKGLCVRNMAVTGRIKGYFLRGLAVLLPAVLTIWIFVVAYTFIQKNISVHINRGLVWVIASLQGEGGIPKEDLTEILVKRKA